MLRGGCRGARAIALGTCRDMLWRRSVGLQCEKWGMLVARTVDDVPLVDTRVVSERVSRVYSTGAPSCRSWFDCRRVVIRT